MTIYIWGNASRYENYQRAVELAGDQVQFGGDPEGCAALLLPGGGDLEPWRYGQKNTASRGLEPERDAAELALMEYFTTLRRPVLGICRGLQTVNVFFGGTLQDVPATALLALLINWMDRRGIYKKENQLLFYLLCSVATGFVACVLVRFGVGVHLDKILIGCIMLTIPGISTTYAARDMLLGESITGLFRFLESLLIAASIAGGFLFSTLIAEGLL